MPDDNFGPCDKQPLAGNSSSATNSSSHTGGNGNVDSAFESSTAAGPSSGANQSSTGAAIDEQGSIGEQSAGVGQNIIEGDLLVLNANSTNVDLSTHRDGSSFKDSNTEQGKKSTMIKTSKTLNDKSQFERRRRRGRQRERHREPSTHRDDLEPCDLGLMGWTGEFPKLTPISNIESNSDKEPLSTAKPGVLPWSGLKVFPRVEPQEETAAGTTKPAHITNKSEEQQQQPSLTTPIMTSPLDASQGELDAAIKSPLNAKKSPNATGIATTSKSSTTPTNMQPSDLYNQVEDKKEDTTKKQAEADHTLHKSLKDARIVKRSMSTHSPPEHSRRSVRFSSHTPLTDETNIMKETSTETSLKVIFERLKQTGVERDLFIPSSENPRPRSNGSPVPKVAEMEHVAVVKCKTVAKQGAVVKGKAGLANPSNVMPQTPALTVTGKRVSKPKVPKGASPPSEGWTSTRAVKGNSRADYTNSSSCGSPIGNTNIRRRRAHAKAAPDKSKPCVRCAASVHPSGPKLCKKCIYEKGYANKKWMKKTGGNEDHYDDDDDSDFSMIEVTLENEISVQQAEKKQLENVNKQTVIKEQEVVVIGGRKAIAIIADPIGCNLKVIPNRQNLAGLKKISKDKCSSSLVQSLGDCHIGCQIVMAVMKIMTMKDRANMAQVCKTWAMISQDKSVWRTVMLRDTHISNWPRFIRELANNCTRELDMLGVILPNPPDILATLDISVLKALRVLRTCPVDDQFLFKVFRELPQLLELRAICYSPTFNFLNLARQWSKIRVLQILMTDHRSKVESLDSLGDLVHLTELNIRGVNYIGSQDFRFLKKLVNLKVLVLSSCQGMDTEEFGQQVLPFLTSLRRLRLENKHMINTTFPLYHIMCGVAAACSVQQLELVNVEVDDLLTSLIGMCTTVTHLLLVPKCLQNSANVIYSVMRAVRENASQLRVFRLGLVTQLLSATGELYRGSKKDVIPVERPVPGIPLDDDLNYCAPDDRCIETDHTECVTFLPAKRLLMILRDVAPTTFVTFVKVNMFNSTMVTFLKRPQLKNK